MPLSSTTAMANALPSSAARRSAVLRIAWEAAELIVAFSKVWLTGTPFVVGPVLLKGVIVCDLRINRQDCPERYCPIPTIRIQFVGNVRTHCRLGRRAHAEDLEAESDVS